MPTAQGKPQPGDQIRNRTGRLVGTVIRRTGGDGYSVQAQMGDRDKPQWITEFEWWRDHNGWRVIAPAPPESPATLLAEANTALDLIAAELSGREWSADTTDAIADIIRSTGRDIRDPFDTEEATTLTRCETCGASPGQDCHRIYEDPDDFPAGIHEGRK